jgi:hypothetical protein
MSDLTWSIVFESYLLLGTGWLLLLLIDRRISYRMLRWAQAFRPWWTERHSRFVTILLLCIFLPLTIYNTMIFFGLSR